MQEVATRGQSSVFPNPPPVVWDVEPHGPRQFHLSFDSFIRSGVPENDRVKARLLLPPSQGKVPLVILIHGLGVTDDSIERRLAQKLNSRGIAALIVQLPYHLSRTPKGYRSGALAIQPDVFRLKQTIRQAVTDLRSAVNWAESDARVDQDRIGVVGTSLGAIVASLGIAVEPRVKFAALILGGADMAHILWHSSLTISVREALRKQGFVEAGLRREIADIEPANYVSPALGPRVFLIGALFDNIVPEADTKKLHEALGKPPMLWLETGHYGAVFVENRVFRHVADFFDARFKGQEFVPPSSIHAPTVRVGLTAEPQNGVQVAASLDLWRNNRRGDLFVSALLSTRGPALFAGLRGPLGFSPGIIALPKRTVPALLWHFVL